MTTCLTCQHWQPKKIPAMARFGFAQCIKKQPGHTFNATAPACEQHKPVDESTAQKRAEFMKGVGR